MKSFRWFYCLMMKFSVQIACKWMHVLWSHICCGRGPLKYYYISRVIILKGVWDWSSFFKPPMEQKVMLWCLQHGRSRRSNTSYYLWTRCPASLRRMSINPPPQTKQKWTAAPAQRTRSNTTCWSSCSLATARWRRELPAPSASTTTSSWSSSADTRPASTAAQRWRPVQSADRPSASGSSYSSEPLCPRSS